MMEELSLEWSYTPVDFFEAPVDCTAGNYPVHIGNGRVVATFASDQPDSTLPEVHKQVERCFLAAQPFRNRPFQQNQHRLQARHRELV